MRQLVLATLLFSILSCQPIPPTSEAKRAYSEILQRSLPSQINSIEGSLVSFHNEQLNDYQLKQVKKDGCDGRRDNVIVPISPIKYNYVSDSLIIRWKIWDEATKYFLRIYNAHDQDYAAFQIDQEAVMIKTEYFEKNGVVPGKRSGFVFQFTRTTNQTQFCSGRHVILSNENPSVRNEIRNTMDSMSSIENKIAFLLEKEYTLDALSLIELQLAKRKNPALVKQYWSIANDVLKEIKPSIDR